MGTKPWGHEDALPTSALGQEVSLSQGQLGSWAHQGLKVHPRQEAHLLIAKSHGLISVLWWLLTASSSLLEVYCSQHSHLLLH